ncbi:REP-associated tyrosine transposase [Calycomorphotria hydatis]|uniref:Transposase IS200 like protein n=1 Tax=Calycomorphotria hydatis TaxID=2528027 RepID=A0A517TCK7_9PLAN|nr:transposase [Calycomorphotria hydatis]QDT66105.1 Transposase IS200 like protein [Calycomorphotria hydatis]
MDQRRIIDDELYAHFVTFSCYKRRRLLDEDRLKRIVLGTLSTQLNVFSATCIGYVVMPDHVHAMVWFPKPHCLSDFMRNWKESSSFRAAEFLKSSNYFKDIGTDDPFWQPKYYPFSLYSRDKVEEKLDYMHENPVRAGLVKRAVDWPWSSARWYLEGRQTGVPLGWIECD